MKDIPGYEGLYAVTEDGRVWSHPKGYCNRNGKFLKLGFIKGYRRVTLARKGVHKDFKVHRLVALTYLPNLNNDPVIRHLDNNKSNNSITNLEWCTHLTNIRQAFSDGLNPDTEKKKQARIINGLNNGKRVAQFTLEGAHCRTFNSMLEAERITGISGSNICSSAKHNIKRAGGFIWRYL